MNEDKAIRSDVTLYARDENAEYVRCDEMRICGIVEGGNNVGVRNDRVR